MEKSSGKLLSVVKQCDWCEDQILGVMYDARIPKIGQWANLCPSCFWNLDCTLGTGRGQRYMLQPDGSWIKAEG